MRASSVKRWHIVRTSTAQSLAEHTFNVMCIVIELSNRLRWASGPAERLALVGTAMTHDLDEIWSGDIPTPAKPPKKWPNYVADNSIIMVADLMDALLFIRDNAVDSHGRKVQEYLEQMWRDMLQSVHKDLAQAAVDVCLEIMVGDTYEQRRSKFLEENPDGNAGDGACQQG